ncbi:uncharacterized protein METZ01_LOCUS484155, partial [marine metagenome]
QQIQAMVERLVADNRDWKTLQVVLLLYWVLINVRDNVPVLVRVPVTVNLT